MGNNSSLKILIFDGFGELDKIQGTLDTRIDRFESRQSTYIGILQIFDEGNFVKSYIIVLRKQPTDGIVSSSFTSYTPHISQSQFQLFSTLPD